MRRQSFGRAISPFLVLMAASFGSLDGTNAQQTKTQPHVTVRLMSRLGIESDFIAKGPTIGDELLLGSVLLRGGARVQLLLAKDVYASVPVWDLKEAAFAEGRLTLTLVNGATLRGQGVGSIESETGQSFSLNSIARLTIIEMSKEYPRYVSNIEQVPPQLWRLVIGGGAAAQTYTVKAPRFAFKYYSSEGYWSGGRDHIVDSSKSYWIKQGAEDLETPFDGFAKVTLAAGSAQSGLPVITVVAPNGTTTTGPLVLKAQDSKGSHDASEWAIHALLDGVAQTRVLAKSLPITLERIQ